MKGFCLFFSDVLAIVFIHEETWGGRDTRRRGTGWDRHQTPQGWNARQSTQMYCKQTRPLTAFFIHLKERRSTAKAIAQRHHSAPTSVRWSISSMWHPPSRKLGREQGGPMPLWAAALTSSHWTQMAGESPSGATPTHSHLVPAVDSASTHQQGYSNKRNIMLSSILTASQDAWDV